MRRWLVLTLCAATPALAGDSDPTELVPHVTNLRLDGTMARFAVRYTVAVTGPGDNGGIPLTVPTHAVVTGATASIGGAVHPLVLTPSATAEASFEAIMAAEPGPHRTWAIQLTGEPRSGRATLTVAVPQPVALVLDLEVEQPTCFLRDVRYVELPQTWAGGLAGDVPRTKVPAASVDEIVAACGGNAEDTWLALPTRESSALPGTEARVGVTTGRLALSTHHFARVEVDLARELATVPRDLHTAIVIDGSRSLTDDEATAQRGIVEAYLRAAPQSRVQVIAYARDARALLPGWMTAASAAARTDRELRALEQRNGSNVDAGLEAAAAWLGHVTGTRRVIVFTDERVADRLSQPDGKALKALLPPGTLVHVVALEGGRNGMLARDDEALFAPLALATEGVSMRGHASDDTPVDATVLARPIALEQVTIDGQGWTQLSLTEDTCSFDNAAKPTFDEGRACTWWARGTAVSGPVTISGLIWNKRITRVVQPDAGQARAVARRLSAIESFEDELATEIDRAAMALNTVWSLYASWGGTAGYSDAEGRFGFGTGRFDTCGCDTGIGTIGHGTPGFIVPRTDMHAQLAAVVAACHPGHAHVEIELETTLQEIVGVAVTVTGGGASGREQEKVIHDCVVEGVWNTWLAIPNASAHAYTQLAFEDGIGS
jgi:hypothetical protein